MPQKKIILITGCSSGLGLVLAKRLSHESIVYASLRNQEKVQQLQKDTHIPYFPIYLDVTIEESMDQALKIIQEKHQRLDVLINNAGIMHMGFFEDVPQKMVRDIFETNFFGLLALTRKALPLLKQSDLAHIINISSSSGVMAMPALSAYSASKWALEGFSESLRFELHSTSIKVHLIEPGLIRTKLVDENFHVTLNPESDSAPKMQILLKKWHKMDRNRFLDPVRVSKCIEKIVKKPSTRFRQLLSMLSRLKLFLKRLLPYSWYEKIILHVLKI